MMNETRNYMDFLNDVWMYVMQKVSAQFLAQKINPLGYYCIAIRLIQLIFLILYNNTLLLSFDGLIDCIHL